MPRASTTEAIVEAVPMTMQEPADRDMLASASMNCSRLMTPALTSSLNFQTSVPEPMSCPQYLPFSIGPPDTTMAGTSQLGAPITSHGGVFSEPARGEPPALG